MLKDSKTWYRARLRYVVPMAVALGVTAYPAFWALTARPRLRVDYTDRIIGLSARSQPPGDNGWQLLNDIAEIARRRAPVPDLDMLVFDAVWLGRAATGKIGNLLRGIEWLDEQGAFDLLHELHRYPNVVAPDSIVNDVVEFDTLTPAFATVVRARAASIYLALAQNDPTAAGDALEDCLTGVRALSYQPRGVAAASAVRALSAVCHNLEAAVVDFPIDGPTLRRFLIALQSLDLAPHDFAVEGERLSFLDLVQRTYTDDGAGDGRLLPAYMLGTPERPANRLHNLGTLRHARRKAIVDAADEYYELAFAFARMGLEERRHQSTFTKPFADTHGSEYFVLTSCLPYWADFIIAQRDQLACKVARLQIMVAIELHASETDVYPPNLDALVPAFLPAISNDLCFDLDRVQYTTIGTSYVLFDAGPNGLPEGGAGDDTVFNRATGSGAAFMRQAVASDEGDHSSR